MENTNNPLSPFHIGGKSQLFIDKVLVRESVNVCFTQHKGNKHPENPLLVADKPWEGWLVYVYGNVLFDEEEDKFKMWYQSLGDRSSYFDGDYGTSGVTCYATSEDGIIWSKPIVGTIPAKRNKPHNIVEGAYLPNVMKDLQDPNPDRRYKMIAFRRFPDENCGYHTYVSPDGLNWTPYSEKPICPDGDVITGYYDAEIKKYIAFPKIYREWNGHKRRMFSLITSEDFIRWSEPEPVWNLDARDDAGSLSRIEEVRPLLDREDDPNLIRTEYYGIGAYKAESCTIAFPWIITINNRTRWKNNAEGPMELQLAVSRDLKTWERPFRTPLLDIGDPDAWDAAQHRTVARAIRVGDEIRLYYGGFNKPHGHPAFQREYFEDGRSTGQGTQCSGGIGLAIWKRDRFVSVDGLSDEGVLATIPVIFDGTRLYLNASTKSDGYVVVELLDSAYRPIQGFERSKAFTGDDLSSVVVFERGADVSELKGRPICLRFKLRNAELYSFVFR